jgi:hypothetical protein
MEFLQQYGLIILAFVGVVGYFFYLYKAKGQEVAFLELKQDILKLILLAEKKYGDDEGNLKFQWVADRVYNVLPAPFKFFFNSKDLEDLIQSVYNNAKDLLDDGEINNSN